MVKDILKLGTQNQQINKMGATATSVVWTKRRGA
jgi:hypothetical protein